MGGGVDLARPARPACPARPDGGGEGGNTPFEGVLPPLF